MIQAFVYKFGGASVKDAVSIENVANILSENWKRGLVVVVSAMGDTTDQLEKIIHLAHTKQPYHKNLEL